MLTPPRKTEREELARLLGYVRPYTALIVLGTVLMAVMGAIEGLTAFAIKPALDVILNPASQVQKLALFTVPGTNHIVYLNSFVPSRVHHVWSVFALALVFLFLIKAAAEFFGVTLIQYAGLSSVTDLRNRAYSKVVQQPVGFSSTIP